MGLLQTKWNTFRKFRQECFSVSLFQPPLSSGLSLCQGPGVAPQQPDMYRSLVRRLLYLNLTRPDITRATQQLSQFVAKPTLVHRNAAIHLLKYLKGCPSLRLFYPSSLPFQVQAYTDANSGTCTDTLYLLGTYPSILEMQKASHGVSCFYGSWISCYRFYYNGADLVDQSTWWFSLHLHHPSLFIVIIMLWFRSWSIMSFTNNKALDIDCHVIRENYVAGFLTPIVVSSAGQLADFFTKALSGSRLRELLSKMVLMDLHHLHLKGGD